MTFYDLDVIISVGYRIKSPQGVQFRRWSTQRLREYLVQGYTLHQQRFDKNSSELQQALKLIKKPHKVPSLKLTKLVIKNDNKNHIAQAVIYILSNIYNIYNQIE